MGGALVHGSPVMETGASPCALFGAVVFPMTGLLLTDDASTARTSNHGATEGVDLLISPSEA